MVLAGQYLERSVVVRSGGLALDALYHRGVRAPACVLASPHPALGGSMTAEVIAELAWALTRAGHATLRFDYRGVGASQGESRHAAGSLGGAARLGPAALEDEAADLLAAAEQLRATAPEPDGGVCAVGYSFGAAVVLRAAGDPRIARVVLVAPPTAIADFSALRGLEKPALVLCAHHDPLCDRALLPLGPGHELQVVAHADHAFRRGLTELGKRCAAWLRGERPELALAGEEAPPAHDAGELELDPGEEPPLELDDAGR